MGRGKGMVRMERKASLHLVGPWWSLVRGLGGACRLPKTAACL